MSKDIEALRAKHAKELADAEFEEALRAKLPDIGHEWSIYINSLYGQVAGVKLSQPYGYSEKGGPTLQDLLTVAEALPGLPMVKVAGTFTSYLAAQQLPQYEHKNSVTSEEPIAPWIVEAHGGPGARNGSQCDLEWRTNIDGIGLVTVKFELPFMTPLRFAAKRKDYMGGHRYEDARCEVDRDKLFTIYGPDSATPVAQLRSPTKWASGGSEYPSKITQAWEPLDDPCRATVADFARALIAAQQPLTTPPG